MRLSISLDDDLYAVAKSLAKAQDLSLSAAVNQLVRRSLEQRRSRHLGAGSDGTGLPVVLCDRTVGLDEVDRLEQADDFRPQK